MGIVYFNPKKTSFSKDLLKAPHRRPSKFWAAGLLLVTLGTTVLTPAVARAGAIPSAEAEDLKMLAACMSRDETNRFGPNRTVLAEQLSHLGVYLSEDPQNPFFDDLSLALLLRHFRQAKPEQPVLLAAPQGKWLTQDNPELASRGALVELATPLPRKIPRKALSSIRILLFGRNAFAGSLKSVIEDLKAAYTKNPEIFANPQNTLTFEFENSLTQRIDALTLSADAYRKILLKSYKVELNTSPWSEAKKNLGTARDALPTTPLLESESKALYAILQDLPQSWASQAFAGLKISRVQNGISLNAPDAKATYDSYLKEILISENAFADTRSSGKNTITHELGHAVADALRKTTPAALEEFHKISWRERTAISPKEFVSSYAKENPAEDFAETFALYARNSAEVKKKAPTKYAWMKKYLFQDREYFPIYPKNAQIEISSRCEDDIPPVFSEALNLRDAVQLSCEIDPNDATKAQIVARISGLVEEGSGISTNPVYTDLTFQEDRAGPDPVEISSYSGSITIINPNVIEIRTKTFSLKQIAPQTKFKLTTLSISDIAKNFIHWGQHSPLWNPVEQKLARPNELFEVTVPGLMPSESKVFNAQELRPTAISSEKDFIWVTFPKQAADSDSVQMIFNSKNNDSFEWYAQFNKKYDSAALSEDPSDPTQVRIKLKRPDLPSGTYFLNRVNLYPNELDRFSIPIGQKSELSFVVTQAEAVFQDLNALPETLSLQEIKSETPNELGGDTSISIAISLNDAPRHWGFMGIDLVDPKLKRLSCRGSYEAGPNPEIRFECPLPKGHLAGTYSVEEIDVRQRVGESATWATKTSLVRQGIRKTIQVRELSPSPKPVPPSINVTPEL